MFAALMSVALLSSCSRPVAYFQKSQRESFTTTASGPAVAPTSVITETPAEQPAQAVAVIAEVPAVQAVAAVAQLDAMVSSDSKLAADKSVQKRMNRVKQMLATASEDEFPAAGDGKENEQAYQ